MTAMRLHRLAYPLSLQRGLAAHVPLLPKCQMPNCFLSAKCTQFYSLLSSSPPPGAMEDASRKPDLLFLVHTSLDRDGVKIAMSKGAAEGWESDRLVFWPLNELDGIDLPLTPVTAAAIHCLKLRQPQ